MALAVKSAEKEANSLVKYLQSCGVSDDVIYCVTKDKLTLDHLKEFKSEDLDEWAKEKEISVVKKLRLKSAITKLKKNTTEINYIDLVCHNQQLLNLIKSKYPNVGELWKYNPKGTLILLEADKVVTFKRKRIELTVEHKNNDNLVTWKEYRTTIGKFWHEVNPSDWLEPAREYLTESLHDQHYK